MNVLMYSHVPLWTIHHAETVEIILEHISNGDTVFMMPCYGELASCPANPFHKESLCKNCRKQSDYTEATILESSVHKIELKLQKDTTQLPKFDTLNQLTAYEKEGIPFGELVASSIVSLNNETDQNIDQKRDVIIRILRNSLSLYDFSINVIKDYKINKVYAWNGRRASDGPVLYAARALGVAHEAYISGGKPGTYTCRPVVKVHDLSFIKQDIERVFEAARRNLPEEEILEESASFFHGQRHGLKKREVHPGFTQFSKSFSNDIKFKKSSKRTLLIFPTSIWERFGMRIFHYGEYGDMLSAIERIVKDPLILTRYDIIVRWHPNAINAGDADRKNIEEVIERSKDSCTHYLPESGVNSYKLIEEIADVVLTFGSTMGIEATFMGKPSILIGNAQYEELSACYNPQTHIELIKLLSADLPPLPTIGAVKYAFWARNFGENKYTHLNHITGWDFTYKENPLKRPRTILEKVLSALLRRLSSLRSRLRVAHMPS